MWRALCLICVVKGSVNYMKAMRGFILHQSNPPCRDLNADKRIPCTVTGQEDYERLTSANCCKYGFVIMTCLPLSLTPVDCFCHSGEKGDLNTGIRWNDNWEETTGQGLTMRRRLCDTQAGWCLDGMLVYLVKTYAPLDSQITASSVFHPALDTKKLDLSIMVKTVPGLKLIMMPHHGSSLTYYRVE